jgi:ankyrin repeat and BTB/POZ domain-containing protein 1
MSGAGLLRKDQLELSLHEEKKLIEDGILKEDNPLDVTDNFRKLCGACRRGDLKVCQEMITEGVNINARDSFDYTPLILVSLIAIMPLLFGEPGQATLAFGEAKW